jgi:hypothetical protein
LTLAIEPLKISNRIILEASEQMGSGISFTVEKLKVLFLNN